MLLLFNWGLGITFVVSSVNVRFLLTSVVLLLLSAVRQKVDKLWIFVKDVLWLSGVTVLGFLLSDSSVEL